MKKFTVCLLIGAMAASMLTGCGSNGGSSDSSDSKADSSSETMTIMMNGSDSDAYMEGYRKIIDGFNESNEYGVKVEIQNVTNSDYKTKLTTMMASDSETDIIFTWELGYLENFVNGDKIVSLQKYLDEDEEWKNSFNGGILDPLTYDGEVYAIPTQQSTAIMYYNKAIFDKYGLEVPTTYDEYVQVCDTLKENGVTPQKKAAFEKYILIVGISIPVALGVNNLLLLSNLSEVSEGYKQASEMLYTPSLPVQIICLGIVIPIMEELIFKDY